MSFELFESLMGQLRRPEILRLNYSGESLHYPRLADAIRLARRTGATTEIVTALGSAPRKAIEALVDSQLHRLSVSLHSLQPERYAQIYGFGSVGQVESRLSYLRQYQTLHGSRWPEIDFAFVALQDNLEELPRIARYASEIDAKHLSIHPVIQRTATGPDFSRELDGHGELREEFAARLTGIVEETARTVPGLTVGVARPIGAAVEGPSTITCDQNPWNTLHILADGTVVPCEVQDRTVLGNLASQSLAEIWSGPSYQQFRRKYLDGSLDACHRCPWRTTTNYASGEQIPVRGWHLSAGDTARWSESDAAVALVVPPRATAVVVEGLLPPAMAEESNRWELAIDGNPEIAVVNGGSELMPFSVRVEFEPQPKTAMRVLRFGTTEAFCPAERGAGPDLRRLGFAMTALSIVPDTERAKTVGTVLRLLEMAEQVGRLRRGLSWRRCAIREFRPGVSVVIPVRGTPATLSSTLQAAETAIQRVCEPTEMVVVVSDSDGFEYRRLVQQYSNAKWIFRRKPLHYSEAVERGLRHAKHDWVYLLNSDMRLEEDALSQLLPLRGPTTFGIGSRILMQDGSRTETNWTALRYPDSDAASIVERDPSDLTQPTPCLYVGGGSGLFRVSLLRRFLAGTNQYKPFYWEDVEWGTRAWLEGFESTFCPTSRAVHGFRQTVRRYYEASEVSRVFERNRLLFHMRNLPGVHRLHERLLALDEVTWREVLERRSSLLQLLLARFRAFGAFGSHEVFYDTENVLP